MKLFRTLYICILTTLSIISCHCKKNNKFEFINSEIDSMTNAKNISMSDLINNFKKLDGQTIQTEGFVYFEFENVAIFLEKNYNNKCFWLDLDRNLTFNDSLLQKASGQKFIIKGTIDTSSKGHLGSYPATIKNVYYLSTN